MVRVAKPKAAKVGKVRVRASVGVAVVVAADVGAAKEPFLKAQKLPRVVMVLPTGTPPLRQASRKPKVPQRTREHALNAGRVRSAAKARIIHAKSVVAVPIARRARIEIRAAASVRSTTAIAMNAPSVAGIRRISR